MLYESDIINIIFQLFFFNFAG